MKFTECPLRGAFIVELEPHADDRGFFARSWCSSEFSRHGLDTAVTQCNISFNKTKGTIRGMHYQAAPHEESKLVRCTKGAIYDVIVDTRPSSPTYLEWFAAELNEENRWSLFVPKGFAHGFQTLADQTEVFYMMSVDYVAAGARGIRWNDPLLGIDWPLKSPILSPRDSSFPDFKA